MTTQPEPIDDPTLRTVWCIRCESDVALSDVDQACSRSPGAGPHEGIAPPVARQAGWSLHLSECEARRPWLLGSRLQEAWCSTCYQDMTFDAYEHDRADFESRLP